MSKRLLDIDPVTGLIEWFHEDATTGECAVEYEQDTSAALDFNKSMQAESWDKRSEMWHAANIPAVVIMEWITKHGVDLYNPDHKAGVRRLLNSDEYRHLRVRNFTI